MTLLGVPRAAASTPETSTADPFATRRSGPFSVLSVLPLLRENRSPVTWSRLVLARLRMAPFVDVTVLALSARTGPGLVSFALLFDRITSFVNVNTLPGPALKIGAPDWNSIVSNTAPSGLSIVVAAVASSVRAVWIG